MFSPYNGQRKLSKPSSSAGSTAQNEAATFWREYSLLEHCPTSGAVQLSHQASDGIDCCCAFLITANAILPLICLIRSRRGYTSSPADSSSFKEDDRVMEAGSTIPSVTWRALAGFECLPTRDVGKDFLTRR